MSRIESNLDIADPTMALRNRRSTSQGPTIGYGIIATISLPFMLQKLEISSFCLWLAILMAGGLIVAGIWSVGELLFARDVLTDREADDRQHRVIISLLVSTASTVVMFLAVRLVTSLSRHSWTSYDLLKSGGWLTYVILGLLPVVAYILLLHAVATRQLITSFGWRIVAIVCMAVSLLAPWFWVGYKVYNDYH